MVKLAILAAIAALTLSACGLPQQHLEAREQQETQAQKPLVSPLVGRTFWTSPGIQLFVYSTPDFAFVISKNFVRAKGRFVIDSYVGASYQGYDKTENRFHVTFADGASGYVGFETGKPLTPFLLDHDPVRDPLAYPLFLAHLPPAEAARRQSLPGVVEGSTKAEILASAWGPPTSKTTECEYGYVKGDDCDHCRVKACLYYRDVWLYPEGAKLTFAEDQVLRIQR